MSARYIRREPLDLLERDGEALALLAPDRLVALSPIATLVHASTPAPVSLEELTKLVVATFGTPPTGSASAGVADVVAHLVDEGLLDAVDG